jgi:hypothetical protein
MIRTLIPALFFFALIFISCTDKEKEEAELERIRQDSIRVADSLSKAQETARLERQRIERKRIMEQGDTFGPEKAQTSLEGKIAEGKVIVLTDDGETMPFRIEGNKVMAVSMPDGKLYQVSKDGDKIMLQVPGKGEMERREVNGKIYLVDKDDTMYEVKLMNNKLIAVIDEDEEIILSKR